MKLLIINKKTLIMLSIILLLMISFILFLVLSNKSKEVFLDEIYYQGNNDDKTVAFLCNVDWGDEYIPEMLKIFDDKNISITFLLTGRWAEKNPTIVKDIQNKNHEIGNHGFNHLDYSKLNYDQNLEQIQKADNVIRAITGTTPVVFGPPSGAFNENTIKAANSLGYKVVMWSVDTIDWRKDSYTDIIVERVISKIEKGSIVLMHPTDRTVEALPKIVEYLYNNGYKIGKVSDVI